MTFLLVIGFVVTSFVCIFVVIYVSIFMQYFKGCNAVPCPLHYRPVKFWCS